MGAVGTGKFRQVESVFCGFCKFYKCAACSYSPLMRTAYIFAMETLLTSMLSQTSELFFLDQSRPRHQWRLPLRLSLRARHQVVSRTRREAGARTLRLRPPPTLPHRPLLHRLLPRSRRRLRLKARPRVAARTRLEAGENRRIPSSQVRRSHLR